MTKLGVGRDWHGCVSRLCVSAIALGTVNAGCGKWADTLACGDQGCGFTADEWSRVQSLAHMQATPAIPDRSNGYLPIADWTTGALKPNAVCDASVQLGWHLYYEPLLSGSVYNNDSVGAYAPSTRSAPDGYVGLTCASCHDPRHAGSDVTSQPRHVSIGAGWYDVNAQQTLNSAHLPVLYWNGRTDTLWAQAAQVMESPVSMNGHRLRTFWVIVTRYRAAYQHVQFQAPLETDIDTVAATLGAPPDLAKTDTPTLQAQYEQLALPLQEVVTRVHVNAAKAIAAYEWLLSSDNAAFDRFASEGSDSSALSPAAVRGLRLFIGRASCIDCHRTPMLSDGRFHNIGIPQIGEHVPTVETCDTGACDCSHGATAPSCLPAGAYAGHQKLVDPPATQAFHRGGPYDDDTTAPPAVPDPTPPPARWMGAWRTPSLRDVALTAPYMHDGSLATLSDVVWHYAQADSSGTLGTSELAPLTLSTRDRDDLVAFLESLTGEPGPPELLAPPSGVDVDVNAGLDAGLDGGSICAPINGGTVAP